MIVKLNYPLLLLQNSSLPFDNNDITIEKVMAALLVTGIYFIPTIIARDKKDLKNIFFTNLLTGWSGVGWLITLVWSIRAESNLNKDITKKKKKKKKSQETLSNHKNIN
jgi:hypothetical protein